MIFERADLKKPRAYTLPQTKEPENFSLLADVDWQKKIVVEVGCGTGVWSLQRAQQQPNDFHIAIERTHTKFQKLASQALHHNLPNLLPVQADAIYLLAKCFPNESVDLMTFFYPNPYPKKSQANKRFFTCPSLWVILEKLKIGGELVVVSNIAEFVAESKAFLDEFSGLQVQDVQEISCLEKSRTAFEKKYGERGEKAYELWAKRI